MVMAARLSAALGHVDEAFVARLTRLIERAGLPVVAPVLDEQDNVGRYLELMRVDKKAEAGQIKFVVIAKPGVAAVQSAPDEMVAQVIRTSCQPA
jgi:3-dehydroquinate synthase